METRSKPITDISKTKKILKIPLLRDSLSVHTKHTWNEKYIVLGFIQDKCDIDLILDDRCNLCSDLHQGFHYTGIFYSGPFCHVLSFHIPNWIPYLKVNIQQNFQWRQWGSSHAWPSAQPPIDTHQHFLPQVSAKLPSNITTNPSEVISKVSEP